MQTTKKQILFNWEEMLNRTTGKLTFFYPIGAASEVPVGLAHMLEHLIANKLAALVANISANTTRDFTEFTIIGDASQLHNAMQCLFTIAELKWDEEEVEREKSIILRELDQYYLDSNYVYREQLQAAIFANQSYGLSITGNKENVAELHTTIMNQWTSLYPSPVKIEGCGPWKQQDIQDLIRPFLSNMYNDPNPSFLAKVDQIGVGYTCLPVDSYSIIARKHSFQGSGWVLNHNEPISQHASEALLIIWKYRLKRAVHVADLKLNPRIFVYDHAGVFTLDHAGTSFLDFQCKVNECLTLMNMPLTKDEYKYCKTHLLIHYFRSRENLLQRPMLSSQEWLKQFPSLEQLQCTAQAIVHQLNLDEMISLGTDESYNNSYKTIGMTVKQEKHKYPVSREPLELTPIMQVKTEDAHSVSGTSLQSLPNDYLYDLPYVHLSTLSLTERYHVLYRVESQRLLQLKDISKSLYQNGMVEHIRYEGNETMIHLAFFKASDLIHSIESVRLFLQSVTASLSSIKQDELHFPSLEFDLKWNTYEAMKHYDWIGTNEHGLAKLKGVSILQPMMSQNERLTVDHISQSIQNSNHLDSFDNNNEQATIDDGNSIHWSRDWTGVVVAYPIPVICRQSFIVQECAFGLTERDFDSLESWIRKKGFAYRIVQSIIAADRQYHYFGVQCSMTNVLDIIQLVKEWIQYLVERVSTIEQWANQRWSNREANEYDSVGQCLRSTDRFVYYKALERKYFLNKGLEQSKDSYTLFEYVQEMLATHPKIIRFGPLEQGERG
ncbi:M16 family metallopeptidase [Paenibacillus kandeliae]|uniref:M16 family metallopeptidase n=1 Tax=Paenibacillus kandeliae TaxID=3231269 RepID=UPI0034597C01